MQPDAVGHPAGGLGDGLLSLRLTLWQGRSSLKAGEMRGGATAVRSISSSQVSGRVGRMRKTSSRHRKRFRIRAYTPPALSMAVLAVEELAKLCAIDGLLFARREDEKELLFRKTLKSHSVKLATFDAFPFFIINSSQQIQSPQFW